MYNDEQYHIEIRNSLSTRATSVRIDNKGNLTNLSVLSEGYYLEFLNILLGWNLVNANSEQQNMPGIDLIDRTKRIAVQVTATAASKDFRKKIEQTIKKFNIPDRETCQLYIVPIAETAPKLKKDFELPENLFFDRINNVLDITRIMQLVQGAGIDVQKALADFVRKYDKDHSERSERRIINFAHQNDPQVYSVPKEVAEKGKDTLAGLAVLPMNWIVGDHGMGKTTYMKYLINKEISNPTTKKSIIWVDYTGNFSTDLKSSLKKDGLKLSDVNLADCIVFIDNANESIAKELMPEEKPPSFLSVISVCSFSGNAAVQLRSNVELAGKILVDELGPCKIDPEEELLKKIVKMTNGHPYVASLLGIQIRQQLENNISLSEYYQTLRKEGFNLKGKNDMKSIAETIAERFRRDYSELDSEVKEILKGFCLLNSNDLYVYPEKIHWKEGKLPIFAELHKNGFLERDMENGYYMHEIMRNAVKVLCGEIRYEEVRELVKAFGVFIDRDNLHGANLITVYNEVMLAYALFSSLSRKNFLEKEKIDPFEYEPDYAWMAQNIFSAFDDFKNDLAYEGSKYAAKLCELSFSEKGLPSIKLAISYNSLGFLPSAYKSGISMSETLGLVTENYRFLQKAMEILDDLKLKGESHEQHEAKIISNIGGTWQRILRIFLAAKKDDGQYAQLLDYIRTHQTDADKIAENWQSLSRIIESAQTKEEGYQNALAYIRSCEETAFQKAYDIRLGLYNQYGPEDEEKRLRRRNLAKTTFVLATLNFFNNDYQKSIRLHTEAIDKYRLLESDGVNVDLDLFVSYSRTANTYYRLAKETHSASALLDAVHLSNTAYDYLNKLFGFNKNGEIVFYEDYLRAAIDLRNYDPKFRLFFNKEDTEIDGVITKLRTRALKAIELSDMDAKTKEKKQKELDLISIQGEKSDYYHND